MSDPRINVRDEKATEAIHQLIDLCGGDSKTFKGDLITQMVQTSLKLMDDEVTIGQLKLMTRALKEIRHAYRIFNQYPNMRCISIFGSARTPEDHSDYQAAKEFGILMADLGWMCMTGAAHGIMKAGLEGSQRANSFGLSIRLPFEIPTVPWIEGDPKSMMFRYFFTRKLMFISHADAVAVFPGGYGTLDELFEVLTLMQTGKTTIVPLVLLEGHVGLYWKDWEQYLKEHLIANQWVSPEDQALYYMASSPQDAVNHIHQFYKRYHSSRYVKNTLVLRLKSPLTEEQVEQLNQQFSSLIQEGRMEMSSSLSEEDDHLELPRLIFQHTRRDFGLVRRLIDEVNLLP